MSAVKAIDVIDRLPVDLAARLRADDYFADIPVVIWEEGNIAQVAEARQGVLTTKPGGKRGIAVIVLQVVGDDEQRNIQFGPMTLRPAFQVVELVELNRDPNGTGKSARKVARRIRDVMKNTGIVGLVTDFKPDKPCIAPINLGKDFGTQVKAYQVNFSCLEKFDENLQQVAIPIFTSLAPAQLAVQITCATPGADIWYTTDDSYPVPTTADTLSTAKQYRGDPVQVAVGDTVLRAVAYVSGMIASWPQRATITVS